MILKKKFPLLAAALGLVALGLRSGVYAAADEKGLLIPDHPLHIALWVVAAVAAALVVLLAKAAPREDGAPILPVAADALGAVGVAVSLVTMGFGAGGVLDGLRLGVGVLAAAGLLLAAVQRRRGGKAHMLCYGVTCLYFALYMVGNYRLWSSQPQMQDWFFPAVGAMAAMVSAYYRCMANRWRRRQAAACLGGFACLAAAGHSGDAAFYVLVGLWMLMGARAQGDVQ